MNVFFHSPKIIFNVMEYNNFLSIMTISQNCLTNNKICMKNLPIQQNCSQIKENKGVWRNELRERCSRA